MALNDRKLVEIILAIMKACVEADNFSVLQRDKNIDFELQYRLDRNKQKEILLELTTEDYFDSDENRNEPGSYLHEFSKTVSLERFSTGKDEQVDIYVKFRVDHVNTEDQTVVISLHELERPALHPFSSI